MQILLYAGVILAAFVAMEGVAWASHKFLMHGPLWALHQDHHRKPEGQFFEKNDYFFLIFALPGMALFLVGTLAAMPLLVCIASGITLYGACYFLVHDVFIHQRFKWIRHIDNAYFRALRRAHKMHHKHLGKHDGECFGMLLFPGRFLKEAQGKKSKNETDLSPY